MRQPHEGGLTAMLRIVARRAVMPSRRSLSVWSGLGFMGMVGWGFAVPVLLGIALGRWMDQHLPGRHVWTLTLLGVGVFAGGMNVWRWVVRTGLSKDEQGAQNEQGKSKP